MPKQTETDRQQTRIEVSSSILKQVWPLPEDFSLFTDPVLPRWVIDREILIGREVDADRGIRLEKDARASREHARLCVDDDEIALVDLKSKNKTFVNGCAVSETILADGSIVRTGDSLFVLRTERARIVDAQRTQTAIHARLLGESQAIRELRGALELAAHAVDNVLLTGPTGSGKELAAAAIHAASPRGTRPFIAINCATLPRGAEESALFGHLRGAFTGAVRDHGGCFQQADTGTLFLDEIGELPLEVQAKLLRALQPAEPGRNAVPGQNLLHIQTYGGQSQLRVDVRVIAASHVDLRQATKESRFREDLFHRLAVLPVGLPSLVQRREDILSLFFHYVNQDRGGRKPRRISARLGELLLLHSWPGNVRELENLSKRLRSLFASADFIDLPDLPEALLAEIMAAQVRPESDPDAAAGVPKVRITAELLVRLLAENEGNISQVARLLRRSAKQIRRLMDQFRIPRPSALGTADKEKEASAAPRYSTR